MSAEPLPEPSDDGHIYINELAVIIDRRIDTIRKWEGSGRLPKSLLPKRGHRDWRYWTHAQVYGPRGIIKWMERNDMRPGNLVTPPEREHEHIANLRRPKYLNGHNIRSARQMAENGRSCEYIVNKIFPRTKYVSKDALEVALRKVAEEEDWEFPAKTVVIAPAVKRKIRADINRQAKALGF